MNISYIVQKHFDIIKTVIVTATICLLVPILINVQPQLYLAWISTFSSIATMFLAFFLFDKFDSKKSAFVREADAVDALSSYLFNIRYFIVKTTASDYSNLVFKNTGERFIYNRSGLTAIKMDEYNDLNVYFSEEYLDESIKTINTKFMGS
jgi:hypothetical protein